MRETDIDQNGYADLEKHMLILHDHEEKHFMSSEIVRDVILGVSDGLTVHFALAVGLSGADVSSSIIVIAGIAEVAAGAISMRLGGYLAATSEADHYKKELKREQQMKSPLSLIQFVVLLLRHTLLILISGVGEYSLTLFTVSFSSQRRCSAHRIPSKVLCTSSSLLAGVMG
ncbi:hypothetical protein TB1_016361 [Malus domestica]